MAIALKEWSELNAVSGNEDAARRYIMDAVRDKCDSMEVDVLGNVIAYKRGSSDKKRILIGSNIDEAGFIVSDITDTGFIKFAAVGSIDARTLISKRVVIGENSVKGIIGMKAVHLTTEEERKKAVKLDELYIDIGAKSKKKAKKKVKKGDYITFDTSFGSMGECIKGKALDRFGSICVAEAMEQIPAYDTYFVFSTQREVPSAPPGRGMLIAAHRLNPDAAIIINTVSAADLYKSERPGVKLSGGAVIEYMDRTCIGDVRLAAQIERLAEEKGIKTQRSASSLSSSIAGAAAAAGTVTACIGIPCRYSHTPVSIMNKNDINAVSALCAAVVKESDVITDEITQKAD